MEGKISMKRENIKLKSNCDELLIDVEVFIPDEKIKGIIQLSHGMVEHKEYYYEFMNYLTQNGYVTIINDHRGHGKSVKNKNDLGFFYEETSDYLVKDLHQITLYIKERFPEEDVTLIGHSMGSLIVRKYLKDYDYELEKLVVCGSPSINKFSKIGLLAAKIVKKFKGENYRSNLLNSMALTNDKSNAWLSYDKEYVNKYNNDDLCGYIFTANGFINLTNLMIDVYSKENWKLKNPDLKILFIAGADDIVIKNKDKWLKSIKFLKDVGYKNIQNILYPNMQHAILNEVNKEKVYRDVLNFIENS